MKNEEKRFLFERQAADKLMSPNAYVVVDKQTGVNYLFVMSTNGGGLTPLLDPTGRPITTTVSRD